MQKKKLIKIALFSGIGLIVIAGCLFLIRSLIANKNSENVTYMVNKETYENVIEISGTVAAAQEQTLQALSDGTVLAVYVQAGDKVKKGDVILQLDDTTEQYNLAKHDYDMATTRISGSERELKLMETQRLSLVQKIADRQVVATFDGIVADLDVAVGDSLEAKDTVGTLVNLDYLTAEVEVAETDVQKLAVGQKVNFTFSALENETVEGYVVGWPAIGEVTSRGATVVTAQVRIDNYPEAILPNFSFTGKIELSPTEENLVVSRYAIAYDEDGQAYVEIARSGKIVNVTVERYGSDYVKVLEGLNGGEVLKQLTKPKSSGWNRNRQGGMGGPGGFGGAGGGAGAGGPPPGM
ncbi:MAG: HlyD family efflux transporter periplasmic adaptor subunit [Treponema sp.]|nr:HlyD family efflux transporter periplasmic adaptor subunit [Treponema sp.]